MFLSLLMLVVVVMLSCLFEHTTKIREHFFPGYGAFGGMPPLVMTDTIAVIPGPPLMTATALPPPPLPLPLPQQPAPAKPAPIPSAPAPEKPAPAPKAEDPKPTTASTAAQKPATTSSSFKLDTPIPENIVPIEGENGWSGIGKTTRYYDCCKPSCAWPGKGGAMGVTAPSRTCKADGITKADELEKSGCPNDFGTAFTCFDNQPVAVNDKLAYGFVATKLKQVEKPDDTCCSCFLLTFIGDEQNPGLEGKQMVVQQTNIGYDLAPSDGDAHFDIMIPGGGEGIFHGCTDGQFKLKAGYQEKNGRKWDPVWGYEYGGVDSIEQCENFPPELREGCKFRFEWGKGMDNPKVKFQRVKCPEWHLQRSGCKRKDE